MFFTILVLNEGCRHVPTDLIKQDEIRREHSVELLSRNAENQSIRSFDGDTQFFDYIKSYVKQQNPKIDSDKFTHTLLKVSLAHNYDPIFLLAVIKTESSFNFNAIGSAGEIGLMQLKPATAQWICKKKNVKWRGAKALKDPEYNIIVGALYFKYLKKTLKSQSQKYITAYNMGLASMKRANKSELKNHPYYTKVTKNYIRIYSDLNKIRQKTSS